MLAEHLAEATQFGMSRPSPPARSITERGTTCLPPGRPKRTASNAPAAFVGRPRRRVRAVLGRRAAAPSGSVGVGRGAVDRPPGSCCSGVAGRRRRRQAGCRGLLPVPVLAHCPRSGEVRAEVGAAPGHARRSTDTAAFVPLGLRGRRWTRVPDPRRAPTYGALLSQDRRRTAGGRGSGG